MSKTDNEGESVHYEVRYGERGSSGLVSRSSFHPRDEQKRGSVDYVQITSMSFHRGSSMSYLYVSFVFQFSRGLPSVPG